MVKRRDYFISLRTVDENYRNGMLYKDWCTHQHNERIRGGQSEQSVKDVAPCEGCAVLGRIPHKSLIFYTINPDPLKLQADLKGYVDSYESMTPLDQAILCARTLQRAVNKYKEKYGIGGFTIHTEFTKSFNIHLHGFISIDDNYSGYALTLVNLQKEIHNRLGRRGKRIDICCNMQWVKDSDVFTYVNKENVFKPKHCPLDNPNGFEMIHCVPINHPTSIVQTADLPLI